MIKLEFMDFEGMMEFANKLLGGAPATTNITFQAASVTPPAATPQSAIVTSPPFVAQPVSQPKEAASEVDKADPMFTMEDVRAKLSALNKTGKREEVKTLLASFGAEKLSEISPEDYDTIMKQAEEL